MNFSRPGGTHTGINDDPALKRRGYCHFVPAGTSESRRGAVSQGRREGLQAAKRELLAV